MTSQSQKSAKRRRLSLLPDTEDEPTRAIRVALVSHYIELAVVHEVGVMALSVE